MSGTNTFSAVCLFHLLEDVLTKAALCDTINIDYVIINILKIKRKAEIENGSRIL